MKVLLLTPINPVFAATVYAELANKYSKTNVSLLCFPFFAEVRSELKDLHYLPTFFAMLKTSLEPDMHKLLYNKQNMLVIGNTYKEEKFDLIIAYKEEYDEEGVFDSYIEAIKSDPELEELRRKAYVDELYTKDDAEIILPTLEHIKLFLEGVFK